MCCPQYRFRSSGNSACRCLDDRPLSQNWRCLQQQMDMVRRYGASYDYNVPRLADLPDQIARPLRHPASQNLISIFRTPDRVVLQVKTACALCLYSFILPILAGIGRLEADRRQHAVAPERDDSGNNQMLSYRVRSLRHYRLHMANMLSLSGQAVGVAE